MVIGIIMVMVIIILLIIIIQVSIRERILVREHAVQKTLKRIGQLLYQRRQATNKILHSTVSKLKDKSDFAKDNSYMRGQTSFFYKFQEVNYQWRICYCL